jgi:hypothetical protein
MERLEELDELSQEERLKRFHSIMAKIIGVEDLFPPDDFVREPAGPPHGPIPKMGAVALALAEGIPEFG